MHVVEHAAELAAEPQGVLAQVAGFGPAGAEVAGDAAGGGEGGAGPVGMQRPDTAAEVQRGEALARLAVVASAAELQAAADRQAELAAAGMEGCLLYTSIPPRLAASNGRNSQSRRVRRGMR